MPQVTIPFEEKPTSNLPGDNLRYYRQRKSLTTRQLAEQIDVVPATILMYERNKHPIKDFEHNPISDQLLESMEASKKIADSLAPILEQEEKLKRIAEGATAHIPNFEIPTLALDAISEPSPAMKAIAEQSKAMKLATSVGTAIDALQHSSTIQTLGELAIVANVPNYTFKNPLLEQANLGMTAMLQSFNNSAVKLLTDSVHGIISSFGSALTATIHSPVMDWLQSIDISPMRSVLENLALEPDILGRYKKFNQAYLTAMYECKWFPYAGWAADITMTAEISDILATSRGASKRREKRIDKVILDYYDKNEIKFIKRIWRESDLEPHIKRILGQALEAHLRGEYALCISSLATMWEGLIYIKANNATMQDRHRQRMAITKKELEDLIEANDYDKIFSDYFNTFIVSQCNKVDDVVDGVPNRHGVSHSWYHSYPSKKASLNAILLTDFIIGLEPLEGTQASA